ncbi:MAG: bifunctional N-acetylglucosamine-1-phosphate uridyltransferase/glucosamine-1-phosphate acetyltransferase [Candidatus Omnitrophica bacterium]|nr:bifunctional N-acetylglucosamine-1-phosphate uridyltransferase/glucosamine-1-phosphate acetyltransferase [Candidatus Omnitrophota bacterium]
MPRRVYKKQKKSITAIVLAAGKGVRMNSSAAKVLHEACGMPVIYYPLRLLTSLGQIKDIIVVLGFKAEQVKKVVLGEFGKAKFSYQNKLNGSAKAVEASLKKIKRYSGHILVMCADSSLLEKGVLKKAISFHLSKKNDCTVLTKEVDSPHRLGRILRDQRGSFLKIKEEVDLTGALKGIKEVNTGIYLFKREALIKEIGNIKLNPRKKEYFLTDIIEIFKTKNYKVDAFKIAKESFFFSVNNPRDLIETEKVIRSYLIGMHIDRGVKFIDPQTTFLGPKTLIGKDSVIYPFTFLENDVRIGNCCSVGPFAHIRPGTVIKNNSYIGNFTELVRSKVASFVKLKHVSYLGDTEVEEGVNIGAGTIVANFDGRNKHKTFIKKNAFIGSDSILVAPVKVGKSAFTAAGSVVTKNVKPKTIVAGVPARRLKERQNV